MLPLSHNCDLLMKVIHFRFVSIIFSCIKCFLGVPLKLETTIEEADLKENSKLEVIRISDKIRISVASPDHTIQHFKIMRYN